MKKLFPFLFLIFVLCACTANPLTGKKNLAIVSNAQLFPMAYTQYNQFLNENTVITGTSEAEMVVRVGNRLAQAAQKLLESEGHPDYLSDYQWEFKLVKDDSINAWAMPGGKIVFYSGIIPVAQNEEGIAVVMGHEIAHAILNHGQQRLSADIIQQLGALGLSFATASSSPEARALIMLAYGVGSNLAGKLPFSREHENEADRYGQILMAIAGYNPDEAANFWERMSAAGGGSIPEFLSTHPSDENRIVNLRNFSPEAKDRASAFGVVF